ncbi:MAG: signal peptidase I [Phenylobacterium sp.]|jgi:signal peptidase I
MENKWKICMKLFNSGNSAKKTAKKFWNNNKQLVLFLVLMSVFRSAVADWNTVPTGSMKPTIVEGDRIGVIKMAYDLRVPFTHTSLYAISDPKRGDIVVFESAAADMRMVKRVIGLPGETIAMNGGTVLINGESANYEMTTSNDHLMMFNESTGDMNHPIQVLQQRSGVGDSFASVVVPEDHYLVLGDNRRNSSDSRVYGFIPRSEIVGRAASVVMSFNYDNYYIPRKERFFKPLI